MIYYSICITCQLHLSQKKEKWNVHIQSGSTRIKHTQYSYCINWITLFFFGDINCFFFFHITFHLYKTWPWQYADMMASTAERMKMIFFVCDVQDGKKKNIYMWCDFSFGVKKRNKNARSLYLPSAVKRWVHGEEAVHRYSEVRGGDGANIWLNVFEMRKSQILFHGKTLRRNLRRQQHILK